MKAISVKNISKSFIIPHKKKMTLFEHIINLGNKESYETIKVLKNISFDIKKGEFIGLVGPNGCGKSTLLRILSNVLMADKGSFEINGKLVSIIELGVGFQADLTARENIKLYGSIIGLSNSEIKSKTKKILSFAGIERFADTKLINFSSGMKARLAFSTSIQTDPDILFLDEVLSVGDQDFKEKSTKLLLDFKKQGKTVVFASHLLYSIEDICDKCILINKGEIVMYDKTNKVINYYNKTRSGGSL